MAEQMTIFDLLGTPDWREMTLKQIAAYISERTGLNFIPDTRYHGEFNEYIAYRTKNLFFTLGIENYISHYDDNGVEVYGEPYISTCYEDKKNHCGGGSPCDTLEEAINYFNYRQNSEVIKCSSLND